MPEAELQVELWRDGKLVGNARCERPRDDVSQIHPLASRCGFEMKLSPPQKDLVPAYISIRLKNSEFELFGGPFELAPRAALIQAAQTAMPISLNPGLPLSNAVRSIVRTALKEFCASRRQASEEYIRIATFPKAVTKTDRRLNIIIPIYRDAMITKNCIDSVLRHRDAATDSIILINDCSPEPEIPLILPQYLRQRNVFLLTNEENRGFLQSVNRGLRFCRAGDIVILNSDTNVFAGAFDELYSVAHSSDDIATVTATSNNATIFSYPHPDTRVEKLDDITWEELAACALRENQGVAIETPTGHGFCMLMKREVVDHIGLFNEAFGRGYGEENEWCCRASDLGYRHVVAAGVFVEHRESISFGDEKQKLKHRNGTLLSEMHPEYDAIIEDYSARDEMRRGRWALDAARLEKACAGNDKIALTIQHSLGGGSATAAADIETALECGSARNLTLTASREGTMLLTVSQPAIKAVFQPQDVAPLFALLARVPIDAVLIHQLIGYSSEFISHLTEYLAEKRSALFLHDYYCFCPRATMINAADEFCNQSDPAVCVRCVKLGGAHEASALTELAPQEHRDLFERLMSRVRHVVAPSEDAAARLRPVFPKVPIRAIPHPQSHIAFRPELAAGSFDNIVVLGAIGPHKGSAALVEIARRAFLSCPNLKFHVIGYTDRDDELLEIGNVTITGIYEPAELSRLLREANGRIALFLNCWPETFSYTLSEAVRYGLIPLVPDTGAPAERVRAADFGVVFPFPIEPATVLETIRRVAAEKLHFGDGDPTGFATNVSSSILRDLFSGGPAKASRTSVAQTRIARRSKARPSAVA
jgi:GT2 family glycosyltransferase/glycosyltransferase involved in cell wall biosynthesis